MLCLYLEGNGNNLDKSISILIPSKNRPKSLQDLCNSLFDNAENPDKIEVLVYFDFDDQHLQENLNYFEKLNSKYSNSSKVIVGPKLILSDYPNKLLKIASSDIFMNLGDDMRCKTSNWDTTIINAMGEYEDKITFVHFDDGYWGPELATHHVIHRKYVECLGYFYPPIFDFGYSDTWMFEVAKKVGRAVYLPILFEHLHYSLGKSEFDQTYKDKLDSNPNEIYGDLFRATKYLRDVDVQKLKNYIKSFG